MLTTSFPDRPLPTPRAQRPEQPQEWALASDSWCYEVWEQGGAPCGGGGVGVPKADWLPSPTALCLAIYPSTVPQPLSSHPEPVAHPRPLPSTSSSEGIPVNLLPSQVPRFSLR